MTISDISWDHWRSFLAVVEEGSLSGAARRVGLTQPTLGRHVDALEQAVRAPLFLRATGGLIPTDLARSLVPEAAAMGLAATTLARRASGPEASETGRVRLAASEIVGAEVLPAVLAGFVAAFPGIGVDLVLSNRNEDLLRAEADLAVRMVRPTQGALVVRSLGRVPLGLYAHRSYLGRRGTPADIAGLAGHALIGPESVRGLQGATLGGQALTPDRFAHRSDTDLAQLAMLRAGLGIGVCQTSIARRDPELVVVLPDAVRFDLSAWLAMHQDLRASRRVRLLYDHLARHLSAIWRDQARSSLDDSMTT